MDELCLTINVDLSASRPAILFTVPQERLFLVQEADGKIIACPLSRFSFGSEQMYVLIDFGLNDETMKNGIRFVFRADLRFLMALFDNMPIVSYTDEAYALPSKYLCVVPIYCETYLPNLRYYRNWRATSYPIRPYRFKDMPIGKMPIAQYTLFYAITTDSEIRSILQKAFEFAHAVFSKRKPRGAIDVVTAIANGFFRALKST